MMFPISEFQKYAVLIYIAYIVVNLILQPNEVSFTVLKA